MKLTFGNEMEIFIPLIEPPTLLPFCEVFPTKCPLRTKSKKIIRKCFLITAMNDWIVFTYVLVGLYLPVHYRLGLMD